MKEPFISVIVIAHDRKQFIKEAIRSVLNQSLDCSHYEVIVVKNYVDREIDEFLDKNSIVSLFVSEARVGFKLSVAIRKSRGNIISLLEDDDTFSYFKLEAVYNSFLKVDDLVIYNNNFTLIDTNGNEVGDWLKIGKHFKRETVTSLNRASCNARLLGKIAFGNASCLSVKKDFLISIDNYLSRLTMGPDSFLFYSLFLAEGTVISDNRKLTNYRMHQSATFGPPGSNIEQFKTHRIASHKTASNDLHLVSEMLSQTHALSIVESQIALFELGLIVNNSDLNGKNRKYFNDLLKSIRSCRYGINVRVDICKRILLGISLWLFPKMAWEIMFWHHNEFMKRLGLY